MHLLIIHRTEAGAETSSVLWFDVGVQGIVIYKFEVIATVALLGWAGLQLEPDHLLVVVLAAAAHQPGRAGGGDQDRSALAGVLTKQSNNCREERSV